ncbi:MAG: hypothetical protein MR828_13845 [Clostridiales bacterium]|nr:hypothetical protein [Clostridiales bacterium]
MEDTQSISSFLELSAEPKFLATSSCRIIQRFPKKGVFQTVGTLPFLLGTSKNYPFAVWADLLP